MELRHLKAALLSVLLVCGPHASAEAPKAWGYLGWWLPQSWRSVPLGQLDRVLFFELKVASNGATSTETKASG